MAKTYSKVWLCLGALCIVSRKSVAKLALELQPTSDFDASSWAGALFFKVVDPPTQNQTCSSSCPSCSTPGGGWAAQTNCGGDISLDLSAHSELGMTFKAPAGYEIEIDGPERSRIEFQAKVPCSSGFGAFKHQEIAGAQFTPRAAGSKASALQYNEGSSFVTLGKCDGCDQCEVYTRVQYDGPIANARFSEISWTISYDQSNTLTGPQVYHYGTELYCWIRGATLVARRLQDGYTDQGKAQRHLTDSFPGNTFKLVKVDGNTSGGAMSSAAQQTMMWAYALLALAFGRL